MTRYARPRVRQLTGRGRRLWVYELRCRCGWTHLVGGGTSHAALAAADQHWRTHHRAAGRWSA